ncbi:MAG: hypothetical protein NNA30_07820, partial [Nitrospira sp.]|nr:hypothetical protein [Nitrospira sp.]
MMQVRNVPRSERGWQRRTSVMGLSGVLLLATVSVQAAEFIPLGHLPGGVDNVPYGVSADGAVVVGRSGSTLGHQAFRWTKATGMVGIGDLPGGDFFSEAAGVSA